MYVPELAQNLLSISRLDNNVLEARITKGKILFIHPDLGIFGSGVQQGGVYIVLLQSSQNNAYIAKSGGDVSLAMWHRRLGHAGYLRIQNMIKHNTVNGLHTNSSTEIEPTPCTICIQAKQTLVPSPPRETRAENVFDVIHSDIEFMVDQSLGKCLYHLKFIDECSGYIWGKAIINKAGATILDEFKALDQLIETKFNKRIKSLHSDNGGEYNNEAMRDYLISRGIQHRTIAPHRCK